MTTTLGTWPQDRYYLSYITQRMMNRAPDWTHARKWPFSVSQQLFNPLCLEIEETVSGLIEERNNMHLSSANIDLLGHLFSLDLQDEVDFSYSETSDGTMSYTPPVVYADISDTEYQLTIAENNDIKSLWYDAIPSRVEDASVSYTYQEVIPYTLISALSSLTPNTPVFPGHLSITLSGNSTWRTETSDMVYYPKVYIVGTTRKGTFKTEAIPLSYNGTFKTVSQWETVSSVFVSYVDDDAHITIDVLPFSVKEHVDKKSVYVSRDDYETYRFISLSNDRSFGSTLYVDHFTTGNMEIVREFGDTKDPECEIELLDTDENNVNINAMCIKENTKQIFCFTSNKLLVYNYGIPVPDFQSFPEDDIFTKFDLTSDRWIYARDETAVIRTKNLDVLNTPNKIRWTLKKPSGTEYYVGQNGSLWSTSTDAWIYNVGHEGSIWIENNLNLLLDETGTYTLTFEVFYSNLYDQKDTETLKSRMMLYVPSITPEIELDLSTNLQDADGVVFNSDGELWISVGDTIRKIDLFYDYYLVDYENKTVWFREEYESARVTI